jgi:hypothetical protein
MEKSQIFDSDKFGEVHAAWLTDKTLNAGG